MIDRRPLLWFLVLAILAPGVVAAQGQGKKKKKELPSLVELPADFVRVARVPEGGIGPRLAVGKDGLVALLYYKGDESKGDLYVTRSTDDASTFSPGVRLNEQEGIVAAFRGEHAGSVDVGADGRVCATWITAEQPARLQYAREKTGGGFEPVQDLGTPPGLGTSTAVALSARGEAFVFYAAFAPQAEAGATANRVWMQKSSDGLKFATPMPVAGEVCDQSWIAAHVDSVMNTLFVLYRAGFLPGSDNGAKCNMRLLSSETMGQDFMSTPVDFGGRTDPRSGADLSQERNTTMAAWENNGEVYWSIIRRSKNKVDVANTPRPSDPPSWRTQPVVASGDEEVILAWLERSSKQSGELPTLGWQVWTRQPLEFLAQGRVAGVPKGTRPVVLARRGHGFTVLY